MPLSDATVRLTREEFFAKYGDVRVKFSCYYKYSFSFAGPLPDGGGRISVSIGGNHDDIYRTSVYADIERTVRELDREDAINFASTWAPNAVHPTETFSD